MVTNYHPDVKIVFECVCVYVCVCDKDHPTHVTLDISLA